MALERSNLHCCRRLAVTLCIVGIFISSVFCEKEPVDESETPRTDSALPSLVSTRCSLNMLLVWKAIPNANVSVFALVLQIQHGHVVEQMGKEDGKANIPPGGNLGFIHAFVAAVSVIVVSELGDKTFFIAAIMAMRHPRLTVFLGAAAALAFMTVLSGWYFKTLL